MTRRRSLPAINAMMHMDRLHGKRPHQHNRQQPRRTNLIFYPSFHFAFLQPEYKYSKKFLFPEKSRRKLRANARKIEEITFSDNLMHCPSPIPPQKDLQKTLVSNFFPQTLASLKNYPHLCKK
jgi:hypothetical protein